MTIKAATLELDEDIVRAYASGRTSWRQVREATGVEDFTVMLCALGDLDLRLPRVPADRPSRAKEWMREILADCVPPA